MSERIRGEGVGFDRVRRITGYLVGTLDRFNGGKRAEERDRVKHGISTGCTVNTVIVPAGIKSNTKSKEADTISA